MRPLCSEKLLTDVRCTEMNEDMDLRAKAVTFAPSAPPFASQDVLVIGSPRASTEWSNFEGPHLDHGVHVVDVDGRPDTAHPRSSDPFLDPPSRPRTRGSAASESRVAFVDSDTPVSPRDSFVRRSRTAHGRSLPPIPSVAPQPGRDEGSRTVAPETTALDRWSTAVTASSVLPGGANTDGETRRLTQHVDSGMRFQSDLKCDGAMYAGSSTGALELPPVYTED